jgi:hypothetical protein
MIKATFLALGSAGRNLTRLEESKFGRHEDTAKTMDNKNHLLLAFFIADPPSKNLGRTHIL